LVWLEARIGGAANCIGSARSSYVAVEESEVIWWRLKVWEDIKPSQTFLRPNSLSFKKLLHQNAKIGQTCSAVHPDPAILPAESKPRFRSNLPPQAPKTTTTSLHIDLFGSRPKEPYDYESKPIMGSKTPDDHRRGPNGTKKKEYLLCVVSYPNTLSRVIGTRCNCCHQSSQASCSKWTRSRCTRRGRRRWGGRGL
jgi:hypothetical protein